MTNRVNPALGFVGAVVLLGTILSCQSPGGLYDLERVGPQHFGYLFRLALERKAEIDELRAIQCPCVPESGIDVEGYAVDFKDNYQRKEYEKARTILVGLHREVDDYSRSMTEARCHWTVSAEKFKPPENPIQCPTGN